MSLRAEFRRLGFIYQERDDSIHQRGEVVFRNQNAVLPGLDQLRDTVDGKRNGGE